jgi:hypothetical protein
MASWILTQEAIMSDQPLPRVLLTEPSSPADAAQAANDADFNEGEGPITGSSKISSLGELRKKAPKLFNKMLEGIAMEICNEMQKHQERLRTLWRDAARG